MTDVTVPTHLEIRHKFATISVNLTMRSKNGVKLFGVRCPSLRLKKRAEIWTLNGKPEMALWMCPVWGMSWNVQVNRPTDEILGVVQREKNEQTGATEWVAMDAFGNAKLQVRTVGDFLDRLKTRVMLFSTREEKIYSGDRFLGTFVTRAGVVHERYYVDLAPEASTVVDPLLMLATIATLSGIFNRLFT
jgi:hypothetical protein